MRFMEAWNPLKFAAWITGTLNSSSFLYLYPAGVFQPHFELYWICEWVLDLLNCFQVFPVKRQPKTHVENPKVTMEIKRLLMEGSEALLDLRSRNAISCYEKALARINPEILPVSFKMVSFLRSIIVDAYLDTDLQNVWNCFIKYGSHRLSLSSQSDIHTCIH